jgi:hypothetical protein
MEPCGDVLMENDPSSQLLAEQLKHLNTLYKALMNAPVGWVAFSARVAPFGPTKKTLRIPSNGK